MARPGRRVAISLAGTTLGWVVAEPWIPAITQTAWLSIGPALILAVAALWFWLRIDAFILAEGWATFTRGGVIRHRWSIPLAEFHGIRIESATDGSEWVVSMAHARTDCTIILYRTTDAASARLVWIDLAWSLGQPALGLDPQTSEPGSRLLRIPTP